MFRLDLKPGLALCAFSGLSFFHERGRAQPSLDRSNRRQILFIGKVSFPPWWKAGRKLGMDGALSPGSRSFAQLYSTRLLGLPQEARCSRDQTVPLVTGQGPLPSGLTSVVLQCCMLCALEWGEVKDSLLTLWFPVPTVLHQGLCLSGST